MAKLFYDKTETKHSFTFFYDDEFNEYVANSIDGAGVPYHFTLKMLESIINMEFPYYIDYCLSSNDEYKIKFRRSGNYIYIYLTQLVD